MQDNIGLIFNDVCSVFVIYVFILSIFSHLDIFTVCEESFVMIIVDY